MVSEGKLAKVNKGPAGRRVKVNAETAVRKGRCSYFRP